MTIPLAFFGGSIGAGEILLILAVGLLFFGAERLPAMARFLGKALGDLQRAAGDLKDNLMDSRYLPPTSEKIQPSADERKG